MLEDPPIYHYLLFLVAIFVASFSSLFLSPHSNCNLNRKITFVSFFFQDIAALTPLSPEVISRQATINIGTIGHVAHGKSTVVKAISGVHTVRFKNELERNITIKLGKHFRSFFQIECFVYVFVYATNYLCHKRNEYKPHFCFAY